MAKKVNTPSGASRYGRRDVFLNHAFDSSSEYLYLSLIAGVVGSGMTPRSVLEIPPAAARIDRLWGLVSRCGYSLHDLSNVKLSVRGFRVPRFNMPFELGLAVALSLGDGGVHQFRLLETERHRLAQSLSDMAGYDPFIHGGSADGVLRVLQDVFADVEDRPLTELRDLRAVYRGLQRVRGEQFRGRDIFGRYAFAQLVFAARTLVAVQARGAN